jgi:kynureninase
MQYQPTLDFALAADAADPLRHFRAEFLFPKHHDASVLYFCGNSLGLQPATVRAALLAELDHWAEHGVEGHFRGQMPWMEYHKFVEPQTARLVGALPHEVVVMNTLTVNLHLLMTTFYRPTPTRYKIVMEAGAFPSDQYAVESQVRWHGWSPDEAIVEVAPLAGEATLRIEKIIETIEKNGDSVALVMFGGVNYFTGQFFDLQKITAAAHRVGAYAGFDLAHAAGNLPVQLHDWGCDFAVWCSYKYLNSGPGGPSGAFVHEQHAEAADLPRFAGWWGHDESERFQMRKGFKPMRGAAGWQLSNAQVLAMAAHKASLDIFDRAGMAALRQKSLQLTGFLEFLLHRLDPDRQRWRILTPTDPAQRGCQLSLQVLRDGKQLHDALAAQGVVADWRADHLTDSGSGGVIRFAPVPLYNSFEDVWRLGDWIEKLLGSGGIINDKERVNNNLLF